MLPSKPVPSSVDINKRLETTDRSTSAPSSPNISAEDGFILASLRKPKYTDRVALPILQSSSTGSSPTITFRKSASKLNITSTSDSTEDGNGISPITSPKPTPSTPPKLGARASSQSLSTWGSFGSTKSFESASSSSPLASPMRKLLAPFPLLRDGDDKQVIVLKRVQYTPHMETVDDGVSESYSTNASESYSTNDGSADAEQVAKLPIEFLDRMYILSRSNTTEENNGALLSFRMQPPTFKPNRRDSLMINGKVIASPKAPPMATKSNHFDCIAAGHIPYNHDFLIAQYIPTDNNIPGAFPAEIVEDPNDIILTKKYQAHINPDIQEVKMFSELVCFSAKVPTYTSKTINGKKQYEIVPEKYTIKHYIQECRSLDSIVELFKQKICEFVKAESGVVTFKDDKNNHCNINLQQLMPVCNLNTTKVKDIDSFEQFVIESQLIATQMSSARSLESASRSLQSEEDAITFHTPIFYLQNGEALPLMVHAGTNGFHVTGDADPYLNSMRSDLPRLHKTFNGGKENPEIFLVALEILNARLNYTKYKDYFLYIQKIKKELSAKDHKANKILESLPHIFNPTNKIAERDYWFAYNTIPYYKNYFIQAAIDTYDYYKADPSKLSTVGQSSVFDLILNHKFDHPLYVHGTESAHPGSKPEDSSAIILAYDGEFVIARDPRSFIAYLWSKPALFKSQLVSIHPFWLLDSSPTNCAGSWLDMMAVQSLYATLTGNKNEKRMRFEFDMFWQVLIQDMTLGRDTETAAFALMNARKEELLKFLNQNKFDSSSITSRIASYFLEHADVVEQVEKILQIEPMSAVTPKLRLS